MKQLIKFTAFFLIAVFVFASCRKEKGGITQIAKNKPPVANAGADQTIKPPTTSVTVDGSGSSDPDGAIVSFSWSQIKGPNQSVIINSSQISSAVNNLIQGIYNFELKVTDNGGLTAKDTMTVIVNAAGSINQSPVAKAGIDQTITLPTNVLTIDASGSSDPDGTIVSYSWTQIIGPNQSVISNSSQVSSAVNNLIQGIYKFEIKVTDNGGLSAKDTVQVFVNAASNLCAANRPIINAQLVQIGTLSQARQDLYTATAGNKILFAGGLLADYYITTRVDIYDFVTNTWSIAELSQGRHAMTVTTIGNKIFFAGGGYDDFSNGWIRFTRVDIYDAVANTWSIAELSEGRSNLASATLGDKVFFAGGYWWNNGDYFSNRVDIYNNKTNSWSTASLSEARQGLTVTTSGNKIYFAGGSNAAGISNKIDIYDGTTDSWSISTLIEGKEYFGSIAVANKIYWAGGFKSLSPQTPSSQVEIRDINTQMSTSACLSQAKGAFGTVMKGNEIVFFMGAPSEHPNNFDIYNTATGIWSIGMLNQGINYPGIISANNKIYVAGGTISPGGGLSNKVAVLEW